MRCETMFNTPRPLGVGFVVPQGYIAQAADALDSAVVQKFATGLCRFRL